MNKTFFFFIAMLCITNVWAQQTMSLSLQDALDIARDKSALSKNIRSSYRSTQYTYQSFKASLKPQLSINGVLPSYDSRLDNVVQQDGSYKVQPLSRSNISTNLQITQNIFWTGGSLFVQSNLNKFVNRQPDIQKQWQSSPFAIGISQPLTLYNSTRWNFEQQKLRFRSATKKQIEDFEDLSLQITSIYFDLYVSKMELQNAQQNRDINDTLYKISLGRFNVGKIAENELLQIELQLMTAQNGVSKNMVNVEVNTKKLENILGLSGIKDFTLLPVKDAPVFQIDAAQAIRQATENRSDLINFQIQENDAKMQLRRSQSNKFASGNIYLSYGLNQTAGTMQDAYKDPLKATQVNIGYNLPLYGFGKNKSDVASSRENLEATQARIDYNKKNFEIDVENAVNQFIQLQTALKIAAKSDTIAQKRFDLAKNRYMLGKINITDLGLAQDAKDKAIIDYTRTLQQYWIAYYNLRRMTLYDFENGKKIVE